jgi:hypothetical protein
MWANACNDDASAHCRSSITTTVVPARAAAHTADASRSKTTKPSPGVVPSPREDGRELGPISASTSTSWARQPPPSASIDRSTWTQGQNAGATPPCQHRPQCTPTPSARAAAASSNAKRVLPIPGGPDTMSAPPEPPSARSSAVVSSRSSRSRPTSR